MDLGKKEQISSALLLVFAVFIIYCSDRLSIGSLRKPGEGFFPFLAGIILGLLSLINFSKTIARRKMPAASSQTRPARINWKNIILALALLFSYPLLLGFLGFLPVTFLFTACFLRFIEPQRWPVVFAISAATALISYFVFQYWLKLQFPTGIFGL